MKKENTKVTRTRSANFPSISLPQAVKIVKDAGAYGKRHSRNAIATYAGHSSATSGPFKQKLSALREWGLITGSSSELDLTDLAMKIVHPPSPEAGSMALKTAFLSCTIFKELYDDSAKGTTLDLESLGNHALHNLHISIGSKSSFIKSFVDSAETVGLLTRINAESIQLQGTSDETTGTDQSGDETDEQTDTPPTAPRDQVKQTTKTIRPTLSQTWEITDGSISFTVLSSKPLAAASFIQLGTIVSSIEELAQSLSEKAVDDTTPPIST